jgi:Protein of unknown function (DUF1579)
MRPTHALLSAVGAIAIGLGWSTAAAQEMPPVPTPGPEHQVLKMDDGVWDAVIEISTPGGPMTSKGVETNSIGCGGLCLITDFKGEMGPGMTFHGHGLTAYDPAKKKYVGSWTDSMSRGISSGESTYDPAAKKITSMMEGPDMTGTIVKTRSVVDYVDADHRVFTMFGPGPDGKEMQTMKISYTRRK